MLRILVLSILLAGCATAPTEKQVISMNISQVKSLAEKGDLNAVHALCYRNMYGYDGATKSYQDAYLWCQKAANAGHNSSQTLLAELYYLGNYVKQDFTTAFKLYESAAISGHSHAQYMLHIMYEKGQGTAKSNTLATYWLQKSASNGHKAAQDELRKKPV